MSSEKQAPIVALPVGREVGGRGEAWSHEDREAAYYIYVDPHQGNRSLRKTSRLTGIPFQTLARWNSSEEWQKRIWKQDEREAMAIRQSVQMRLVNELDGMMDQLIELAYSGTNHDKTRLEAVKLALGIASFTTPQKVEMDVITTPGKKKGGEGEGGAPASESVEVLSARLNERLARYGQDDDGEE